MWGKAAAVALLVGLASSASATVPLDAVWADVLASRVSADGAVAYRTAATKDRSRLLQYLGSLSEVDTLALSGGGAVAFWINAFNAMAMAAVIQGETPETPEGRARMYHWFRMRIARAERTLDEIEAILSRYATDDPRIHLALCNGTRGSPKLGATAYSAERLDAMLAAATRRFVNEPARNRFDPGSRRAEISPLFDWYRGDFERAAGSITAYLASWAKSPADAEWLSKQVPEVRFTTFDWTLNAAPGERPG